MLWTQAANTRSRTASHTESFPRSITCHLRKAASLLPYLKRTSQCPLIPCSNNIDKQSPAARHLASVWSLLTPPGTDVHHEIEERKARPGTYEPPIRQAYSSVAGQVFVVRSRINTPELQRGQAPDTVTELAFVGDVVMLLVPPGTTAAWDLMPEQEQLLQVGTSADETRFTGTWLPYAYR